MVSAHHFLPLVFALACVCGVYASEHISPVSARHPTSIPFEHHGRRLPLSLLGKAASSSLSSSSGLQYNYTIHWFTQKVDHLAFDTDATFQQRYLLNQDYWNGTGPVFFYTGNEGDIEWFSANTGFLWEIAQEYGALVVFAEHRYYGQTLPFGAHAFDLDKVKYLTTEQALADFAELIVDLRKNLTIKASVAVVAFGGSYGGMLSAWFRLKYANVVDGAIAASAPIAYFQDLTPPEIFNQIATNDYALSDPRCVSIIRDAFNDVTTLSKTDAGRKTLTSSFGLCSALRPEDTATFIGWLEAGLTYMAMTDYPYPTNFLQEMPGWPVDVSCKQLLPAYDAGGNLPALNAAIAVYYNYSGETPCNNISSQATSDLGVLGWDYQSCTEMVMPMSTDGVNDMFPPAPWDLKSFSDYCKLRWNVVPRPYWAGLQFGGRDIAWGSNIVFSNGMLDPWSGGSVLSIVSDSLVVVNIDKGAHHLDLRSSNALDPQSVIDARNIERAQISKWIAQVQARNQ